MRSATSLTFDDSPLGRIAAGPADLSVATDLETRDPAARFREMVDRHYDFIWRSLRRLGIADRNVDDAAQHVFWVTSQKIEQIEAGAERSFLFRTAVGVAANERRSATTRRHQVCDVDELAQYADQGPNPEDLVGLKRARAQLDEVIGTMDPELASVFVLFELEGMTSLEIAGVLEVAPGTVASRLRRAREIFQAAVTRLHAKAVLP